jgi:Flp pilus assembly protein TadD
MRCIHPSLPAATSRKALLALAIGSSLFLGGCGSRLAQFTGSLGDAGRPAGGENRGDPIGDLARRYDAKPGEKRASLDYAAALRANGQHPQAVAVLQRTSMSNVGDRDVAAAYGKALADIGQLEQASQVLAQAHSEDRPNWRVLSTLGSVADQMGNHQRARDLYHRAMQIAPNEPSILNNLGLSYVLTKELTLAEETLRKAVALPGADPRIRANLDLALKLQNKSPASAATVVPAPAPAAAAAPPISPLSMAAAPPPAPKSRGVFGGIGSLWKAPPAAPAETAAAPPEAPVEKTAQ